MKVVQYCNGPYKPCYDPYESYGSQNVQSVKSCLRSENCISLVGRRIFHGKRGYIRFVDP